MLFHGGCVSDDGCDIISFVGSAFVMSIIKNGFDERHAYIGGMFGAGKLLSDIPVSSHNV